MIDIPHSPAIPPDPDLTALHLSDMSQQQTLSASAAGGAPDQKQAGRELDVYSPEADILMAAVARRIYQLDVSVLATCRLF